MLNRRYIRIKSFQAIYAFSQQENVTLDVVKKLYHQNILKLQQAYQKVLSLPLELRHHAGVELDKHMQRNFTDANQMALFRVLTDNAALKKMSEDMGLSKSLQKDGISWQTEWDKIHTLYEEIESLPVYQATLTKGNDIDSGKQLLKSLVDYWFEKSEVFNSVMDDLFIGWQEDKPVLQKNIHKTLDPMNENDALVLYHVPNAEWKEIEKFGLDLLEKTIVNFQEFEKLIADKTVNWDAERIALTDSIFMKMAISEFMFFETIPVKVTINEFLELAKIYSTPKSNSFLNGVLDNLQKELKEQGKLQKSGRGLIG